MDATIISLILGGAVFIVLIAVFVRSERARAERAAQMAQFGQLAEKLSGAQSGLEGRMQQSQSQVNERLEMISKRLGDGLSQQTEKTGETLKVLHERLAVIDAAQKNLTDLSQQVVGLQDILSNKQARGNFGEIQLNDLVSNALPPDAYAIQVTLSNGKRVDCLLKLPNPPGPISIDAKFPLDSYSNLVNAEDKTTKVNARRQFRTDVLKHVKDIQEKYILPGETAESALMFLPSEAVYAELHANFRNVIEESFRRRVWIVSPTTLMATLNTVRAVLKDARMREQAGVIQTEVQKLLEDVGRLDGRVEKLQSHFDLTAKDIRDIRISTDKVTKRGEKIETVQLGEETPTEDLPPTNTGADNVERFPGTR
jgi:DNA recombination protein RmuC